MPPDAEFVEGELLPDVYEPPPAPITLFGSDPRLALARMSELSDALMHVVRDRKLAVPIRGREYLTVEAWTTLGALVGVHAAIVWTKVNEAGDGIVARAEARTLDGALVGAAEAECGRTEARWKNADAFQIRSMASTRALSRALQGPLRHIAVMAGYQGGAAEEMETVGEQQPAAKSGKLPPEAQPTYDQVDKLRALVTELRRAQPEVDWAVRCREIAGVPGDRLTRGGADGLIAQLEQLLDREAA